MCQTLILVGQCELYCYFMNKRSSNKKSAVFLHGLKIRVLEKKLQLLTKYKATAMGLKIYFLYPINFQKKLNG